jgi:hypothetical protein
MSRRVVFLADAEAEIAEAVDWYETRGKGLGADFMRSLEATVASIQRIPTQYQIIKDQARRAVLRRFPTASCTRPQNTKSSCSRVSMAGATPERLMGRL